MTTDGPSRRPRTDPLALASIGAIVALRWYRAHLEEADPSNRYPKPSCRDQTPY